MSRPDRFRRPFRLFAVAPDSGLERRRYFVRRETRDRHAALLHRAGWRVVVWDVVKLSQQLDRAAAAAQRSRAP